jgi:hypothetical protein
VPAYTGAASPPVGYPPNGAVLSQSSSVRVLKSINDSVYQGGAAMENSKPEYYPL